MLAAGCTLATRVAVCGGALILQSIPYTYTYIRFINPTSVNSQLNMKQLKIKTSSENWAVLGCYALNSGNFLPTFRYNLSVPTSGVKNSGWDI
jgi:hypothetical protein